MRNNMFRFQYYKNRIIFSHYNNYTKLNQLSFQYSFVNYLVRNFLSALIIIEWNVAFSSLVF